MHGKEKPRFNLRSEYEKPRLMNRNKQVPISFGFREKPLQCVQNPPGGGGGSHMERTGMLVGNFEFTPERRPSGRRSSFL